MRMQHSGEAAAAAYLALGHASLLDKHYAEAAADFRQARQAGEELADYADFLGARANHEAGNDAAAEELLHGFAAALSGEHLCVPGAGAGSQHAAGHEGRGRRASEVLAAAADTDAASRPGYQLAQGQVLFMLGRDRLRRSASTSGCCWRIR
jgi:soluble lytic murein transglycosylase